MNPTRLTLDVYCETTKNGVPAYRVYVDNDLLTERSWIWPAYEIYIHEYIEVMVDPGTHQVKIESCGADTNFITKNFTVNEQPQSSQDLTFTV
jgi:hypothetical protein